MSKVTIDSATLAFFELSKFGLAIADAKMVVTFAIGQLASVLPTGETICASYAPFRGLDRTIMDLQKSATGNLSLADIALAAEENASQKMSLTIAWDKDTEAYTISSYPSHGEADMRLIRSIRLRRISDEIIAAGMGGHSEAPKNAADAKALVAHLSEREREVVALLAAGQPNKGVARILGLSTKTVEAHRARALKRLNAKTTAELIRIAIEADIVDRRGK